MIEPIDWTDPKNVFLLALAPSTLDRMETRKTGHHVEVNCLWVIKLSLSQNIGCKRCAVSGLTHTVVTNKMLINRVTSTDPSRNKNNVQVNERTGLWIWLCGSIGFYVCIRYVLGARAITHTHTHTHTHNNVEACKDTFPWLKMHNSCQYYCLI